MLELALPPIAYGGHEHFAACVRFAERDTGVAVHAAAVVILVDRLLVLFGESAAALLARPVVRLAFVRYDDHVRLLVQTPGVGEKKRKQYYRAEDGENFNQK